MKITPKTFFSFENNLFFSSEHLVEHLSEDFVLEGEYHLSEQGIDTWYSDRIRRKDEIFTPLFYRYTKYI